MYRLTAIDNHDNYRESAASKWSQANRSMFSETIDENDSFKWCRCLEQTALCAMRHGKLQTSRKEAKGERSFEVLSC